MDGPTTQNEETIRQLTAAIDALQASLATRQAAIKTSLRDRAIDSALTGYSFLPGARETALNHLRTVTIVASDEAIHVGDAPLERYTRDYLTRENPHFLQPANVAGTGAHGGQGPALPLEFTRASLEMIRPGMSQRELDHVLTAIRDAWPPRWS